MKAILANIIEQTIKEIDVEKTDNYKDYISGDMFDIVCKKIGNKYYDMIYTDLGEILIFNSSGDGVSGLKDNDIKRIKGCYCEMKAW